MENKYGYGVYEEDVYDGEEEYTGEEDIEGVTDEVTSYTYTNLEYPCIVLNDDFTCPKHKLEVLSRMVKMSDREIKDIALYMSNEGDLYKIGSLSGTQMKAFYQIIGEDNVRVFFSEEKELLGDKKYVLCV